MDQQAPWLWMGLTLDGLDPVAWDQDADDGGAVLGRAGRDDGHVASGDRVLKFDAHGQSAQVIGVGSVLTFS